MSGPELDYLIILVVALLPLAAGPTIQTLAGPSKIARYRLMMIALGILAGVVLAAWTAAGRPIGDLGLVMRSDPGFLLALGLASLFVVYVAVSFRRVAEPERADRARKRLGSVAGMLPDTRQELLWFIALGLVAGLVEELVYRGYLLLGLSPGGPLVALIVSALAFGVAHLYQGLAGGAGSALFGLALGLVTLLAGSIIPAIVIHVTQDVGTGMIAYRLGSGKVGSD